MNKEEGLVEVKQSIFYKIIQKIKSIFIKVPKQTIEEVKEENPIDDIEYLRKIISGEIKISELDYDLKTRLVKLCNNRLNQINIKIEERTNEYNNMKELLTDISVI